VRTTESEGNTKTLARANGNIGAKATRRCEQCEGEQVGRDNRECVVTVYRVNDRCRVSESTARAGVLDKRAKARRNILPRREVDLDDVDVERFGSGEQK
jgi:hypothetical protein